MVHLLWCPGGPWADPGMILGHWRAQGSTLQCPGSYFIVFGWFRGPILRVFWTLLDQKRRFFISFSRLFFLETLGFEIGRLGLQEQAFGMGCIAKINFRRSWSSHDSRVCFSWFWLAWGPIFLTFVALETGSKFNVLPRWFWGHPDPGNTFGWW